MDPTFLLYLSLAAVILLLSAMGLIFLIPKMLMALRDRGGGWTRLAGLFPAADRPEGPLLKRQTLEVGRVVYKNCATVGWTGQGLYLEVKIPLFSRLKPLLIPWDRISGTREGRLHWKKTVILSIGQPEIGTVTLFQNLFEKVRAFLPEHLRGQP